MYETIVAAAGQTDFNVFSWQLRTERNTSLDRLKFEFMIEGSNLFYVFRADNAGILQNSWNHLVVQRDYSAQELAMWVNGSRVYTETASRVANDIRRVSDKSSPILRIGAKADSGNASFPGFKGYIDQVRIIKGGLRYSMDSTTISYY